MTFRNWSSRGTFAFEADDIHDALRKALDFAYANGVFVLLTDEHDDVKAQIPPALQTQDVLVMAFITDVAWGADGRN